MNDETINGAVELTAQIEEIGDRHRDYSAVKGTEALVPVGPDAVELSDVVNGVAEERVAQAAALIKTTREGLLNKNNVSALGKASVLSEQSAMGYSEVDEFHKNLEPLLDENGYRLTKSETVLDKEYLFFTDGDRKVVAVERNGCDVVTAELNSRLDYNRFIDNFEFHRDGTTQAFENDRKSTINGAEGGGMAVGAILGLAGGMICTGIYFVTGDTIDLLPGLVTTLGPTGIGTLLGGRGCGYVATRVMDSKKAKMIQDNPIKYISKGTMAVIDAFPLKDNEVLRLEGAYESTSVDEHE